MARGFQFLFLNVCNLVSKFTYGEETGVFVVHTFQYLLYTHFDICAHGHASVAPCRRHESAHNPTASATTEPPPTTSNKRVRSRAENVAIKKARYERKMQEFTQILQDNTSDDAIADVAEAAVARAKQAWMDAMAVDSESDDESEDEKEEEEADGRGDKG